MMNINKQLPHWRLDMMLEHYNDFLIQVYSELSKKFNEDYVKMYHEAIDYMRFQIINFPELYQNTEVVDFKTSIQNLVRPESVYYKSRYRLDRSYFKDDFYWPSKAPLHINREKAPLVVIPKTLVRTKWCYKCSDFLPFFEFGKNSNSEDGLSKKCKSCSRSKEVINKHKKDERI